MQQQNSPAVLTDAQKREDVANANYDGMLKVMEEYRFTIRARDLPKWRPTVPTSGVICGIDRTVVCVATDGILGLFIHPDFPPLEGHVAHFIWTTAITSMVPYVNEFGEHKWFKSVKDRGAPAALNAMPKKDRPAKETTPKKPKVPKAMSLALAALLELE